MNNKARAAILGLGLGLMFLLIFFAANRNFNKTESVHSETDEVRIKGVERINYRGRHYIIISVDGQEYLTTSDGGIIKLGE